MTNRKTRRKRHARKRRSSSSWFFKWRNFRWFLGGFSLFAVVFGSYVAYLDFSIRHQLEGKRWAIPARVYARPLEIYPDAKLNADQFQNELNVLAYRQVAKPERPGTYARKGRHFFVVTRSFTFWDGDEPSLPIRLDFVDDRLAYLRHAHRGVPLPLVRLDPGIIGRIYPSHTEDRVLVKLDEVPPFLLETLITVEDRDFYTHVGVSLRSIARAMMANIKAGATVQGGSTLTQQLVKNFFLTNERSLWRKANEAIMALLLEWNYEKDEILEAYLNEIYLGQDGKRAIHGFGLASQFYFEKSLSELRDDQIALMVAMVKGPSYYSPRRRPERAKRRRNLVLDMLADNGVISKDQSFSAKANELGVSKLAKSSVTTYPAFLDLVRRQLKRDYKEEDLNSEGLQIFTTLDPMVQYESEKALFAWTNKLGKRLDTEESPLQAASVVLSVEGGEVLSIVGDRNPQFAGFNRALDAVRPVGSLIKPAVYLTALSQPDRYTLASLLDDGPLSLEMDSGKIWAPENFDREYHGLVPLHLALAKSYNLSTARLGLDIGVPAVIETLHALGIKREMNPFPSLLLGAVAMTPIEVAQMYHTLATGGFRRPVRAIRAILTSQGQPLQRYALSIQKVMDSSPVFLLNTAMQETVRLGTGRGVYQHIPRSIVMSGKTGTSDDLRDSWFAGYTSDRLGVVWMGMDSNRPAGLTGGSGALHIWGEIFRAISPQSIMDIMPEDLEMVSIDSETGLRGDAGCDDVLELPFIKGSAPIDYASCSGGIRSSGGGGGGKNNGWFKGLFR